MARGRGIGTATIAFCNTIVGLGLGPTLVAVTADRFYAAPDAIGPALTTVAAPAIALCCALFFAAAWMVRKTPPVAAPA